MTFNLPPGCTLRDIDRTAGEYETECDKCHEVKLANELWEGICEECEEILEKENMKERDIETPRERATELEYLTWFRHNADFGPAESDVIDAMHERFMDETGKNIPAGWNFASDGETIIDRD